MSTHTCPNCDNQYTGQYCNECGQRVAHKITMAYIRHDLAHAFTHTDKGFFYMMGQLFIRPGKVAYEYIVEAKRKRYFPPFQFLIIIGAVVTFIMTNSHYLENTFADMSALFGPKEGYTPKQTEYFNVLSILQTKYFNIIMLLQIPFFALATHWLYNTKKYNYAEKLTLQCFINGPMTIIGMLVIVLYAAAKINFLYITFFSIIFGMLYQSLTLCVFFNQKNIKGVLKACLSYIIGFCLFAIFQSIVNAVILMIFFG